ncbi:hypothetical protein BGX38DRAFT_1278387 [Terfezia claveryi]|nr:hypothetical protein BGX38DRAFT_1278387 [Terfezia claveryi]
MTIFNQNGYFEEPNSELEDRLRASASQNEKDALIIAARSLSGFRSSMRNRLASGSESYKKVLEALLQDCLKKRSEISKNLAIKRTRKRAHDHKNTDEEDDISDAGEAAGTAVAFWVCDPEIGGHRDINGWIWDERDRRRLGVIQIMTLDGIWDMVKAYVPADRKVREILDALRDPNLPNLSFPADYTGLRSNAEVKAFFRMSKSDPPILTSTLRSLSPGTNMKIFAEDSDVNIRNVARKSGPPAGNPEQYQEEAQVPLPNAGIIDSDDEVTATFDVSNGQNYLWSSTRQGTSGSSRRASGYSIEPTLGHSTDGEQSLQVECSPIPLGDDKCLSSTPARTPQPHHPHLPKPSERKSATCCRWSVVTQAMEAVGGKRRQ